MSTSKETQQILEGFKIIEFGTDIASAYAGRLCALYGAEVITIEPLTGHSIRHLPPWPNNILDPEKSILFAYLGMGKKSLAVDLENQKDIKIINELIISCDGLIESYGIETLNTYGINIGNISEIKPSLSIIHISPYGQHGSKKDWIATSLTSYASGGQLHLSGDPDKAPMISAGHQAYYQSGIQAFGGLLAIIYASLQTGIGDSIDLSIQGVQAATLERAGPDAVWYGLDTPRRGNNPNGHWGVQKCIDGWIGIASMRRQISSILNVIGMPELQYDPLFSSGSLSEEADILLQELISQFANNNSVDDIFMLSDKYRAPFAKIPSPRELLEIDQYKKIDFWKYVTHPILGCHPTPSGPIEFDGKRGQYSPAPTIGQHTDSIIKSVKLNIPLKPTNSHSKTIANELPLKGLRVVDMTQVWSGPYGTRFLSDMGAEVIKIEGPTFPDPIRTAFTTSKKTPGIDLSSYFNEYNRGKKSMVIDFKKETGKEVLLKLLETSDVFIENWASGVADRNGLSYEFLKSLNPKLIYVSMPGFGHSGPDSSRIGFGPTIEQMGGLVALQGYQNGPPHKSGISYGDPIAGSTAAASVMGALIKRVETGKGTYCVIPQRDGITNLIGEYIIGEHIGHPIKGRQGYKHTTSIPHNVFKTTSEETLQPTYDMNNQLTETINENWVSIECRNDDEWEKLKVLINNHILNDDLYKQSAYRMANTDTINQIIESWTITQTAENISEKLQSVGIPASPVLSPLMLVTDKHLNERETFITVDHAIKGPHLTTRPTWRMKNRSQLPRESGPCFGSNTVELLTSLGYSTIQINEMYITKVTSNEILE